MIFFVADVSLPPACRSPDVWSLGCLLFAGWFGYSPFECEFTSSGSIQVVECSASRVLAGVPRLRNPSPDDSVVLQLVQWILSKDLQQRPYSLDIMERIKRTHHIELPVLSTYYEVADNAV